MAVGDFSLLNRHSKKAPCAKGVISRAEQGPQPLKPRNLGPPTICHREPQECRERRVQQQWHAMTHSRSSLTLSPRSAARSCARASRPPKPLPSTSHREPLGSSERSLRASGNLPASSSATGIVTERQCDQNTTDNGSFYSCRAKLKNDCRKAMKFLAQMQCPWSGARAAASAVSAPSWRRDGLRCVPCCQAWRDWTRQAALLRGCCRLVTRSRRMRHGIDVLRYINWLAHDYRKTSVGHA